MAITVLGTDDEPALVFDENGFAFKTSTRFGEGESEYEISERLRGIDETASNAAERLDNHDQAIESINGRLDALEATPTIATKDNDFTLEAGVALVKVTKVGATCIVTLPDAETCAGRIVRFKIIAEIALQSATANIVPMNVDVAGATIVALHTGGGGWATIMADSTANLWEVVQSS